MLRRKGAAAGSYDSLLDTLSNVIGILVMTLAVSQLDVEEAINRIRYQGQDVPQVSSQQIRAQNSKLEEVQQQRQRLEQEYQQTTAEGALDHSRVGKRERIVELLQRQLELSRENQRLTDQVEGKGEEARKQEERMLADRVAANGARAEQLAQEVRDLEKMRGQLEQSQHSATLLKPKPKQLRLPDPRPPPTGSTPILFYCRYGKLYYLGADELLSGKTFKLTLLRDGRVSITVRDRSRGETRSRLVRAGSKFQSVLDQHSPRKEYVRFIVWPDSFLTYVEARGIAEEKDYAVGWMVVGEDHDLVAGGGGGAKIQLD